MPTPIASSSGPADAMPYGPHTGDDRARMLAALGLDSVEPLFADIPASVRAHGLDLPGPEPELALAARLERLAARNRVDLASFLGAGVYRHYIPAAVDQILSRGEFYTAYTPYQPEISQGTLQTIYEYQSLLAELTGLADGTTDLAALERSLAAGAPVAGVVLGQPNVFGLLEPMAEAARLAHAAGALFVVVVEPVSLAVLAPPGAYGADIAAGEGQPLGIAPMYGGPYLGVLATTDALIRQIPGRLVGRTTDLDGRRAFVMTMRAREQDIRREKAASNICTNQALCALAATVYLATIGPHGLRDVAAGGAAKARELERALRVAGAPRVHRAAYLNEFAVHVPGAQRVHAALLERGVLAGLPPARWYPADLLLRDALLG